MKSRVFSHICMATVIVLSTQIWGCASESYIAAKKDSAIVQLAGTGRNTGQIGRAVLVPREEVTEVAIEVIGLSVDVTTPLQLYSYIFAGRCGQLGGQPQYSLTKSVLATGIGGQLVTSTTAGPFNVTNIAPVPIARLKESSHAIVVRTSPADGGLEIFCGNI